jgi:hypothetical protein
MTSQETLRVSQTIRTHSVIIFTLCLTCLLTVLFLNVTGCVSMQKSGNCGFKVHIVTTDTFDKWNNTVVLRQKVNWASEGLFVGTNEVVTFETALENHLPYDTFVRIDEHALRLTPETVLILWSDDKETIEEYPVTTISVPGEWRLYMFSPKHVAGDRQCDGCGKTIDLNLTVPHSGEEWKRMRLRVRLQIELWNMEQQRMEQDTITTIVTLRQKYHNGKSANRNSLPLIP